MPGISTINSPLRAITRAYQEAGLVTLGDSPDSELLAQGLERANDLLAFEQTQGLKLWLEQDLPIALTGGQNLYPQTSTLNTILTKPTRVKEGYFQYNTSPQGGNPFYPLIPLARNDWDTLGNRTVQGNVTSYYVDKQPNVLNVWFWLTPSAAFAALGQCHLIIQQQQQQAITLTETLVLPQEWFLWLMWAIADEICTGQPDAIMERCAQRAAFYRDALESWDIEDAPTQFAPDTRFTYQSGNSFT
jgi:hypothetical protein